MAESKSDVRRPSLVNRLLAGWQPARVLMAASHLDFFTSLSGETLTAEEIAARCGTHPRSTRLLLNACVAIGLLEKDGPLYRNSAEAGEFLVKGKPSYMGDAIAHTEDLWLAWYGLPESVRTNDRVSEPFRRSGLAPEGLSGKTHRNFIMAMHTRALQRAPGLVEELDLTGRRQLFDAGGGPGTYSIYLVKRYPGLMATVFDLPQTIGITKEIIAEFGVEDLVTTRPGNYHVDGFGQGNDVVLLSAILHSLGPERNRELLTKAFDSLIRGGLVVVQEGLIGDEGTGPLGAVLFSLNMLVNTGEGQSYSAAEIIGLLQSAGFVEARLLSPSLIVGVRP